jgi:hypothetical protein
MAKISKVPRKNGEGCWLVKGPGIKIRQSLLFFLTRKVLERGSQPFYQSDQNKFPGFFLGLKKRSKKSPDRNPGSNFS